MSLDVGDKHLIEKIQSGNKDAFLELYNRYINKVYRRVKSRIPVSDVEDVTQEIFIAVARSIHKFEKRSKFNTWLYTIVNRHIADYYRKANRTSDTDAVDIEAETLSPQLSVTHAVDEKIIMQQALIQLPENYQEIILMRFADGLTFAEIAHRRGQSLEAAKSLYRRAIKSLTDSVNRRAP